MAMSVMDRVPVMGMGFDPLTEAAAVDRIITSVTTGRGGWVVTPNTDVLRQAFEDPDLCRLLSSADLVVADGMPVVWASRLQRTPLPERVAGSAIIRTLAREAAGHGIPVFLLGGNEGVAERAVEALAREIPGVRTGHHFPPFGFEKDPEARAAIETAVTSFGKAIYFLGLGTPKQEILIAELVQRHPESWFIGCGAGLTMLAGDTRRAPRWMQRSGLEWLHRLKQEPRRLFRRYIVVDAPFALRMAMASLKAATLRRRALGRVRS
jgi:N-acetylglucosaminyldiphosphoundecaprenol N-acetyl-beta-D-mannosaminyltransferase